MLSLASKGRRRDKSKMYVAVYGVRAGICNAGWWLRRRWGGSRWVDGGIQLRGVLLVAIVSAGEEEGRKFQRSLTGEHSFFLFFSRSECRM